MNAAAAKNNPSRKKPLRIAIAAGGTGGHIMPAIALGQTFADIGEPVELDFFCGNRPVEKRIYEKNGIHPRIVPVGSIQAGSKVTRLLQYMKLVFSFLRCFFLMGRYDAVVCMGGYVAAPVVMAGWLRRRPIVLHDSNTVLGRVNRMMAKRAKAIACGMPLVNYPENIHAAKFIEIGTPVRLFIDKGDRVEAAESMYFQPGMFTLFIYGGSLGARALNKLMAETLGQLAGIWPPGKGLQVIWATGKENLEEVRNALRDKPIRGQLWLAPEIERMDLAYAASDLIIARSGGSFLAEIMACGKPAILFPLPSSAENHQYHNAQVLARHGAALVRDQNETSPSNLAKEIAKLAARTDKLQQMSEKSLQMACPDAARDLARLVIESTKKSK